MHATLSNLPTEILLLIISFTLPGEPVPSNILCINRQFHNAGAEWLYSNLCFHSQEQLRLFAQTSKNAEVVPRSVTVDLMGKYATSDVWQYLSVALSRCRDRIEKPELGEPGQKQVLLLEILFLRLHSYSQDSSHHLFEEALSVAKWVYHPFPEVNHPDQFIFCSPRVFRWTGPDPEHHFSTAVRPSKGFG